MQSRSRHWNDIYAAGREDALSWFQKDLADEVERIHELAGPKAGIIDIGGGASRMVDVLLDAGYQDITVLDIADSALNVSRARLDNRAAKVTWIVADITRWHPDRRWDLWHDRAVFHFLTDPADRLAYLRALTRGLAHGGHALISTFGPEGPSTCSGLPVVRYAPQELLAEVDLLVPGQFRLSGSRHFDHVTPRGNVQAFQTTVLTHA